jgi:hypothetical protein
LVGIAHILGWREDEKAPRITPINADQAEEKGIDSNAACASEMLLD